jgi:hypothetical protein
MPLKPVYTSSTLNQQLQYDYTRGSKKVPKQKASSIISVGHLLTPSESTSTTTSIVTFGGESIVTFAGDPIVAL